MKFLILLVLMSCSNVKQLKYNETPTVAPVNTEMTTVYFLRSKNLAGINFVINERLTTEDKSVERPIGVLSSNSYFYTQLSPGKHVFSYATSFRKDKAEIEVDLKKAKTYYITMKEMITGSYPTTTYTNMETTEGKFFFLDEVTAKKMLLNLKEVDLKANEKFLIKK